MIIIYFKHIFKLMSMSYYINIKYKVNYNTFFKFIATDLSVFL